jgi:DNA-binding IclR family transcriptional regulator
MSCQTKPNADRDASKAAVAHAFALIYALAGNTFDGLRNAQIAEAVGESQPTTFRRLQALEATGIVERIPGRDERWRLSPRLVQIAIAHQQELARLNQRVDDFTNRYSRSPN